MKEITVTMFHSEETGELIKIYNDDFKIYLEKTINGYKVHSIDADSNLEELNNAFKLIQSYLEFKDLETGYKIIDNR